MAVGAPTKTDGGHRDAVLATVCWGALGLVAQFAGVASILGIILALGRLGALAALRMPEAMAMTTDAVEPY